MSAVLEQWALNHHLFKGQTKVNTEAMYSCSLCLYQYFTPFPFSLLTMLLIHRNHCIKRDWFLIYSVVVLSQMVGELLY